MKFRKSTLCLALTPFLYTISVEAAIYDMNYTGLYTLLDDTGVAVPNTSVPYYDDPTWGYGLRTQISGSLQFDTNTGLGSISINPFEFINSGPMIFSDFNLKSAGNGLLIGNYIWSWKNSDIYGQVVFDASGLISELLGGASIGDVYDASTCSISATCTIPASNDIGKKPGESAPYPIGLVPFATTSINTTGQNGYGTTLDMLSLGSDDGIGGSPYDNGGLKGFSANFDFTSVTVTNISSVPLPAAVWLFGSGLLGLIGVTRRDRKSKR